jgi:hypothetical protein
METPYARLVAHHPLVVHPADTALYDDAGLVDRRAHVDDGLPEALRELLLEDGDDLVPAVQMDAGLDGLELDDRILVQHLAQLGKRLRAEQLEVAPGEPLELFGGVGRIPGDGREYL